MPTIRVQHRNHYTAIANNAIRDKQLSFKARGLLALLLSYPDDWRINGDHLASQSDKDGRSSVYSGLKELEDAGYIIRTKIRLPNGQFQPECVVSEIPHDRKSGCGFSEFGLSESGKPSAIINTKNEVTISSIEDRENRDSGVNKRKSQARKLGTPEELQRKTEVRRSGEKSFSEASNDFYVVSEAENDPSAKNLPSQFFSDLEISQRIESTAPRRTSKANKTAKAYKDPKKENASLLEPEKGKTAVADKNWTTIEVGTSEPLIIQNGTIEDQNVPGAAVVQKNCYDVFMEVYNDGKPRAWKRCTVMNAERVKMVKKYEKQLGNSLLERFQLALKYVNRDKWWSGIEGDFEKLFRDNRIVTWSEGGDRPQIEATTPVHAASLTNWLESDFVRERMAKEAQS